MFVVVLVFFEPDVPIFGGIIKKIFNFVFIHIKALENLNEDRRFIFFL